MYGRVVAGTDLSRTAGIATTRAAALAAGLGAELVLVYAGRNPGAPLEELAAEHGATARSVEGPPAEVLISESERAEADLLVVGSVGMSGARRFLLGNVPNKVSHHAPCDLLIVKTEPGPADGGAGTYTRVLAGTDGSDTAMRAVDAACTFAARLGAAAAVVCAYEGPSEEELKRLRADPNDPIAQWNVGRDVRTTPDEFRWRVAGAAQAEDVLERAATRAARAGVDADVRAVEGQAASVLLDIARSEGFDLIAVGSVGMAGAGRFTLGNVPHRISHHSPTDVLVVKTA